MKNEIVTGLINAIERGQPLDQAAQSLLNAGYAQGDVDEAVAFVKSGGVAVSRKVEPEKPIERAVKMPAPQQPEKFQKPEPIRPALPAIKKLPVLPSIPAYPRQLQIPSQLTVPQSRKIDIGTIILIVALLLLILILAGSIFFLDQLKAFIGSIF